MKLAFIINSLVTGGAERQFSNLLNTLSKENKIQLFILEKDIEYTLNKKIILHILSNNTLKTNKFKKILNYPKIYYKLLKKYKKIKPKKSISFLEISNFFNILVSTKTNTGSIISTRAYLSNQYKKGIYGLIFRFLIKKLYSKADLIITNSKLSKEDLIKNFKIPKEKIKVIYNPVDIKQIEELKKEKIEKKYRLIFNKKNKVILNVGRLTEAKGQWHLIRAFKEVKKEIPNVKLVILGEGELKNYLRELIKELKLEENVFLLGNQTNPFKFVSNSNLFVFTSLWEGFPNALLEALACKTPVISTDCKSGPREILAPNTNIFKQTNKVEFAKYGILIPPLERRYFKSKEKLTEREKILAKTIINVLRNNKLLERYSKRGFERAKEFDIKKIINRWRKVIYE